MTTGLFAPKATSRAAEAGICCFVGDTETEVGSIFDDGFAREIFAREIFWCVLAAQWIPSYAC